VPFADWGAAGQIDRIRQLYLARKVKCESMHWHRLEVVIGTLTNGATASPDLVIIPSDADFLWMGNLISPHPEQSVDATGPPGFATLMRIELQTEQELLGRHRDTAGDAAAGWIPLMNVCGRGRMPFLWPWPIMLRAGDKVKFDFLHRGASDLVDARFTLLGVKIVHEVPE
jgi:hypothetical protein